MISIDTPFPWKKQFPSVNSLTHLNWQRGKDSIDVLCTGSPACSVASELARERVSFRWRSPFLSIRNISREFQLCRCPTGIGKIPLDPTTPPLWRSGDSEKGPHTKSEVWNFSDGDSEVWILFKKIERICTVSSSLTFLTRPPSTPYPVPFSYTIPMPWEFFMNSRLGRKWIQTWKNQYVMFEEDWAQRTVVTCVKTFNGLNSPHVHGREYI